MRPMRCILKAVIPSTARRRSFRFRSPTRRSLPPNGVPNGYRCGRIPTKTKLATFRINIPANVAVGTYTFKAFSKERGESVIESSKDFDKPIAILFNPWSAADTVYMPTFAERSEYVLRDRGIIWQGKSNDMLKKRWGYLQFNPINFKVTLGLLNGVSATNRANPVFVSRHLSAKINWNDNDGGVIAGR